MKARDNIAIDDLAGTGGLAKVGTKNNFFDQEWDFGSDDETRMSFRYKIKWNLAILPEQIVLAIRIFAFCYLNGSKEFGAVRKPVTVIGNINRLIRFLNIVYERSFIGNDSHRFSPINSIWDINFDDISKGAQAANVRLSNQKFMLCILSSISIQKTIAHLSGLSGKIQWTVYDIKTINTVKPTCKRLKNISADPLPDRLVNKLILASCSDVYWLAKKLGLNNENDVEYFDDRRNAAFESINFTEALKKYGAIRKHDIDRSHSAGIKVYVDGHSNWLRKQFKNEYRINPYVFKELLEKLQSAARYIVLQFTGMRYSEISTIKKGTLIERNGKFFITGKVFKRRVTSPQILNNDYWVAIPVVRVAIKLLEMLSFNSFQDHVFSPSHCVFNKTPGSFSSSGMIQMLNKYLYDIDLDREFSDKGKHIKPSGCIKYEFRLSPHRIRNTLANQLFKCRASLIVISYHFHHSYLALKLYKVPNEVTAGYGNINREILSDAASLNRVKKEIVNSIYNPDSPIAGEGAALFKQSRNDFFIGEYSKGKTKKQILKDLEKRALPFADVVLGFCGGKNKVKNESNDDLVDPPCIGSMKCNPARCGNAIIPDIKKHHWESYLQNNLKFANDPHLFYAKDVFDAHVEEAKKVLTVLNHASS